MMMKSDVWVVIPAYNEEKALAGVLAGFAHLPYRVVVVDDGSSDRTGETALQYPVTLLTHVSNLGQGAALQTGIDFALRQPDTRYIVTFDADGQHQTGDIEKMLDCCRSGGYDVVLGSRFLHGGKAENIHPLKWSVLKLAIFFTRISTGLALTDTHNGLRLFTREAAQKIRVRQNGMAHASEILSEISAKRLRYHEVPVTISYTAYSLTKGQSVLNSLNIVWDIWTGKMR